MCFAAVFLSKWRVVRFTVNGVGFQLIQWCVWLVTQKLQELITPLQVMMTLNEKKAMIVVQRNQHMKIPVRMIQKQRMMMKVMGR
jgi:hypothetical protein